MKEFKKVKANKKSISCRKEIIGGAVNDAWYVVQPRVDGVKLICPAYQSWISMIKRAYSDLHPTTHSSVCKEWLTFSVFSKWYECNYIEGYQLDKDIKIKGNKEYSPLSCMFIPHKINFLLNKQLQSKGEFPTGVNYCKQNGMYRSQISIDGKRKAIGYFTTPKKAHEAYKAEKNSEIKRKAKQYPEFAEYLIKHLYK